jgi:hypothetical protein
MHLIQYIIYIAELGNTPVSRRILIPGKMAPTDVGGYTPLAGTQPVCAFGSVEANLLSVAPGLVNSAGLKRVKS